MGAPFQDVVMAEPQALPASAAGVVGDAANV